jgi:GAF domain-containing protein
MPDSRPVPEVPMPHRLSLFSQRLDRVAHLAYFLGAVVPLAALALAGSRWGLRAPGMSPVAFITCAALLTLACFFALRRVARRAVSRMEADAESLVALLNACSALSTADDADEAARTAAGYAARLTGARAGLVALRSGTPTPTSWRFSTGAAAKGVLESHEAALEQLAADVMHDGRPALRCPAADPAVSDGWSAPTVAAVPLMAHDRECLGALLVVHADDDGRFEARHLEALLTIGGLASLALENARLRCLRDGRAAAPIEEVVGAGR